MSGKRIAIICVTDDWNNMQMIAELLVINGYEVDVLTLFSWERKAEDFPLPPDINNSYDIVIVYGFGSGNWFVNAVNELTVPTIYLTSYGEPNLDKRDTLKVIIYDSEHFSLKKLIETIEELTG